MMSTIAAKVNGSSVRMYLDAVPCVNHLSSLTSDAIITLGDNIQPS